jgi:hypothetical protein
MKRLAIIVTIVAAVVLVIGLVEDVTNYKWSSGDQNAFFGNPRLLMNDGTTALIVGGILALVSGVIWLAATRKGHADQRQRP